LPQVAIGTVHHNNGDFSQALNFYQQSIDILEKARAAVRIEEFKTKLADQSSNVYQVTAALSLKLNRCLSGGAVFAPRRKLIKRYEA
jgi:hypothetical protein